MHTQIKVADVRDQVAAVARPVQKAEPAHADINVTEVGGCLAAQAHLLAVFFLTFCRLSVLLTTKPMRLSIVTCSKSSDFLTH